MSTNKKLYRSKKDKMLAGVCAGVAEYFGTDVSIIRLVWVLASIFTAFFCGLIAYIIAAIIIPEDPGYVDV